jgi:hypothetical protein
LIYSFFDPISSSMPKEEGEQLEETENEDENESET